MSAPSRDFLIGQAILNAIHEMRPFYSLGWLKGWGNEREWVPEPFRRQIVAEFNRLRARYGA